MMEKCAENSHKIQECLHYIDLVSDVYGEFYWKVLFLPTKKKVTCKEKLLLPLSSWSTDINTKEGHLTDVLATHTWLSHCMPLATR